MDTEASLINKLSKLFRYKRDDIVVGVGDDAAVLRESKNRYLLATCDVAVEGVHFKKEEIVPEALAERAVAASLSDIAAMGGTPSYILISVVLPQTTTAGFIDKLTSGFAKAGRRFNVAIVGGNMSKGKHLVLDVFALGYVKPNELLLRSGARAGDIVAVTGTLGKSGYFDVGSGKWGEFTPRIQEGAIIAKSRLATAMIDISDGLSSDLLRICDASDVGVRLFANQLPIADSTSYDYALNGGEDYELCFTVAQKDVESLIRQVKKKTGTEVTVIGEILKKDVGRWFIDEKGRERRLEARGWDHFKSV